MTKLALLLAIKLFFSWEALYLKDGKGASSCDSVDGSGKRAGTGKSRNLVEKIFKQSLITGKELLKRKPREDLPKRVRKQKPRIDGPVFSQSPIQMKKVKLRGKHEKPKNFVSKDEEDGGIGGGTTSFQPIFKHSILMKRARKSLGKLRLKKSGPAKFWVKKFGPTMFFTNFLV